MKKNIGMFILSFLLTVFVFSGLVLAQTPTTAPEGAPQTGLGSGL